MTTARHQTIDPGMTTVAGEVQRDAGRGAWLMVAALVIMISAVVADGFLPPRDPPTGTARAQ